MAESCWKLKINAHHRNVVGIAMGSNKILQQGKEGLHYLEQIKFQIVGFLHTP